MVMSALSTLLNDNIKPLLTSATSRLRQAFPTTSATMSQKSKLKRPADPLTTYSKAVKRCRRESRFIFLDLPGAVRFQIYYELFCGHTIQVCSFNKDHSGDFGKNERCQILLTCKKIATEASSYGEFSHSSLSTQTYLTKPTRPLLIMIDDSEFRCR
jgi:hypothetical protein